MQTAENTEVTPTVESTDAALQKRKRLFKLFALAIGFICLLTFLYWYFIGSQHIVTDNAYAAADIAQVTPSVAGIVKTVNVVDTQTVKSGDVLVVLDNSDAVIALRQAEASLAHANADFARVESNFLRRKKLAGSGFVSAEELNIAESNLKVAKATLDDASALLDKAKINLDRTIIRAPIDGVVAKREVQIGQRTVEGAHLLSIVPTSQIYVNANFKEVQLKNIKVGQPVEVYADIYGSHIKYHGKVLGIAGGTGSAFAIIPAQNATGNWIKVVQRLPVRIELDPVMLSQHPLQVGLSMHVDVHIKR